MMIKNQSLTAVSKSFSLLKKNNEKIFSRDIFWRIGCIFLWGGVVGWIERKEMPGRIAELQLRFLSMNV